MTALPQPDPDPDSPSRIRAGRPASTAGPPGPQAAPPWPPGGTPADPWPWADPDGTAVTRIRLAGPAELIAAVPVLIGFHPEDSLILVGMAGPELRGRVGLTVRVDLPYARQVRAVCDDAVSALAGSGAARAVAVVVRGRPGAAMQRRVRRDVAVAARRALRWAGITPTAVLWASGTRAGDRWSCYPLPGQDCRCAGTVPDPTASPIAVAAAVRGRAVLPDRAAVRAQLDGDPAAHERRARLRAGARQPDRSPATGRPEPDAGRSGSTLLDTCLSAAAAGRLVIDDPLALEFCAAFDDPDFRDEALRVCLGSQAPHAEQLWAALTRALPAPDRAGPSALLAVCALLRGDGALATLAVERALGDRPDHVLAAVVCSSLRGVLAPGTAPASYAGPAGLRRLLTALLERGADR
ncbi:DUF4192 domain-containing protein [Pseudonocardia sp. C8]|uniref:DUF4192 domain-containing protein n=1 Tax=Pseudonocardia sp. C8 TaxID=2762759 RepID=UPI001643472F|nr:DUF4192 domain-containing protein [Pseudonocardia sp. C8]MBC3192920.1 DUF4192 domain-containing protein [Pseudonocardia sp. C8]